jgi:DNA-binding CsgD family transcriptional regulator
MNLDQTVSALNENGLRSGDRLLLAHARWYSGFLLHDFFKIDLALGNCIDAIEVMEEYIPRIKLAAKYEFLGEMVFQVVDYDAAIGYYKLFLKYKLEESEIDKRRKIVATNAIGQTFLRKSSFSEGKEYFVLANEKISLYQDDLWQGINNAYLGHVYLALEETEAAEQLLKNAIETCLHTELNVASYASNYLGRLYLDKGMKQESLFYLEQAEQLLLNSKNKYLLQTQFYLLETYRSLSDFYRVYLDNRLANEYFEKYKELNDAIRYISILSSQNITRLRMDNEKASWELSVAELEKESIIQRRNILLMIVISLFTIIGSFLLIARNRMKAQRLSAEAESKRLVAEKNAIEAQLNMLKSSLMEKSRMLQEFENRLSVIQNRVDVQDDLERINKMKILTEEDWTAFRKLFERLHPGFMTQLKQSMPSITTAELRLATLLKMQYSAKEMADILGVSTDSVYKARYRLRTKLNLENEQSLENLILNM